jgi:hypothetical protein
MQPMMKFAAFFGVVVMTTGAPSWAQGLRAVAPLQGYSCMSLNLTEAEMQHESSSPVIRQEPSPLAVPVGRAASLVIAVDPVKAQNGYIAVLTLDGKPGWVEANKVKPYRSLSNPNARCVPSMMSNGQPGFSALSERYDILG